jgi:hypothetical protein
LERVCLARSTQGIAVQVGLEAETLDQAAGCAVAQEGSGTGAIDDPTNGRAEMRD